ncbi:hypothetical protein CERSUDRAFT_103678 [Gelatoporia subvermispora B]|uniref:Uncharacterized protein n=1 Tax=Ceriporiopsis subvermispora (strain B) TaxID=914234 RepID=M2RMI9_CERS8|nr:hypothetical protein CERSUDRAFT_103678 [Gelatoporia subvermispora B]
MMSSLLFVPQQSTVNFVSAQKIQDMVFKYSNALNVFNECSPLEVEEIVFSNGLLTVLQDLAALVELYLCNFGSHLPKDVVDTSAAVIVSVRHQAYLLSWPRETELQFIMRRDHLVTAGRFFDTFLLKYDPLDQWKCSEGRRHWLKALRAFGLGRDCPVGGDNHGGPPGGEAQTRKSHRSEAQDPTMARTEDEPPRCRRRSEDLSSMGSSIPPASPTLTEKSCTEEHSTPSSRFPAGRRSHSISSSSSTYVNFSCDEDVEATADMSDTDSSSSGGPMAPARFSVHRSHSSKAIAMSTSTEADPPGLVAPAASQQSRSWSDTLRRYLNPWTHWWS